MVNAHAEYSVFLSPTGKYVFKTDFDILYAVDFELDSNPYYSAYWFNLTNPEHSKSPGDVKIAQTVICIIEEFSVLIPKCYSTCAVPTRDSRPSVRDCFYAGSTAMNNRNDTSSSRLKSGVLTPKGSRGRNM